MRAALATIATIVILCLGPVAVVAQDDEEMPAKEPTVYLSTTGAFTPTDMLFPTPVMVDGVLQSRDGYIEFMVQSDDPRVAGPYRAQPFNMDIDPATGIARMWGTGNMVREDGAFRGPIAGYSQPLTEEVDAYTVSGWLTGSGAYEGLVYWYRATFDGEQAYTEGIIFEGEAPPLE